jgi:hypothetical protein
VQYANTLLKDRMLFGSDYPLITPERWMKDFDEAGFKDKVKPLILKDAQRDAAAGRTPRRPTGRPYRPCARSCWPTAPRTCAWRPG